MAVSAHNTIPSPQELIRAAELETGLSDWSTEFTGDPFGSLEILVQDLNTTAQLHELGIRRMHRRLHETLCSRLKYIADRKRYPQIAHEKLEAPIFILGLPRSGTTFLHNLLGADPANRAPRSFEMHFPAPKTTLPLARELRARICHESFAFQGLLDDDWQAVHPMGAARAEECTFIWELALLSVNYTAMAEVPNYEAHLYARDFRSIYREERAFLQYLQHCEGRPRWILKTPIHVRFLQEILEVFPNATFVHCHRDTARIYPSIAHLTTVLRSKTADLAPGHNTVIKDYDGTWAQALEFRRRPGMASRFVDIDFVGFQADPLGTVESIYQRLDIPLTSARKAALQAWLANDRAAYKKRPQHRYTLEDAGLTLAELDRATGEYLHTFNVTLER